MKSKLFFVTLFITLSSVLVTGREIFPGYVSKKLKDLLECNFLAYYSLKGTGIDPNSFLDFNTETEQFYWFVDHYLSVPFQIPKYVVNKKEKLYEECSGRSWVSEFLLAYKEPWVNQLISFIQREQLRFFKSHHRDITPIGKYTLFQIREFHKYCILPPLIRTIIAGSDNDENEVLFQLNREEYKIYLSSIGSQVTALKYLYMNIVDEDRKKVLKKILENEEDISIICPTFNIKLHYIKDCGTSKNILKCLDNYIRRSCSRRIGTKYDFSFCDHLFFLFENIKEPYLEKFKNFLRNSEMRLVKSQSVWNVPVFKVHKPKDFRDKSENIETNIFKTLHKKNLIFLSFNDSIPKSPYYEIEHQPLTKLSAYASSISDKLLRFFHFFKTLSSPISPVTIEELNYNITDFSFKVVKNEVNCDSVKKTLSMDLDVETVKAAVTEKICKNIEKYSLAKHARKEIQTGFLVIHDDMHSGFRAECIILSVFVEAYNIVRQVLNLESILSLTRYTSLYLHKYFNSVTELKGNFLYKNANALKYANACSKAVLHIPAVLYKRNIYVAESFLSLYLGLSNTVSSNPSSPFFEFAIMEFLVSYFNKGSEKFVLYLLTIISVLQINIYYYEQLFCHFKNYFPSLKSRIIHPDIANRILKKLKKILETPRYKKMLNLYLKFEDNTIFNKNKVFGIIHDFTNYLSRFEPEKKANIEEISEVPIPLDTTNDGIGYREQDLLYEADKPDSIEELIEEEEIDEELVNITQEPMRKSNFLDILSENKNICQYDKEKELEISLHRYIGKMKDSQTSERNISGQSNVSIADDQEENLQGISDNDTIGVETKSTEHTISTSEDITSTDDSTNDQRSSSSVSNDDSGSYSSKYEDTGCCGKRRRRKKKGKCTCKSLGKFFKSIF